MVMVVIMLVVLVTMLVMLAIMLMVVMVTMTIPIERCTPLVLDPKVGERENTVASLDSWL